MSRRKTKGTKPARAPKAPRKPKEASLKSDPAIDEEASTMDFLELPEATRADGRRQRRRRPTPSWLLDQQNHDEVARRRVLMMLRVLSGETAVTDAIEGTDISRQMYYQLEEKALRAMMRALTPGSEAVAPSGPDPAMVRRISELEARQKQLEQEKRRAERMLYLTRKVVPTGPMKSGHRGRPSKAPRSTTPTSTDSPRSKTTKNSIAKAGSLEDGTADSIPRRSAVEPLGGTAS